MSNEFQNLTIKDSFIFAAVMSDEEQCRRLLEISLDMKILIVRVIIPKIRPKTPPMTVMSVLFRSILMLMSN